MRSSLVQVAALFSLAVSNIGVAGTGSKEFCFLTRWPLAV
jgi:hypothetical protein